jgi:hypothetical protein
MKITKELKYATFEYDEETKSFLIIDTEDGGVVELNKIYAFAFMRFVIRMAQRNWLRQKPKEKRKAVELAEHPFEPIEADPNQTEFWGEFDALPKVYSNDGEK